MSSFRFSGGEKVVNDGPFVEGKEIVGGYPVIKASDLPDAIEIAKNCPIFDCDGIVEVREVHQLPNKKLSSLRRPGLALAGLCERTLSLPCTPQAAGGISPNNIRRSDGTSETQHD
jgi:hypothetical protein